MVILAISILSHLNQSRTTLHRQPRLATACHELAKSMNLRSYVCIKDKLGKEIGTSPKINSNAILNSSIYHIHLC